MFQKSEKVEVYVKSRCPKCDSVVESLERSGVPYKKISMAPGPGRKKVIPLPGGIDSLPVVIMPDGRIIQDADEKKIFQELGDKNDK